MKMTMQLYAQHAHTQPHHIKNYTPQWTEEEMVWFGLKTEFGKDPGQEKMYFSSSDFRSVA